MWIRFLFLATLLFTNVNFIYSQEKEVVNNTTDIIEIYFKNFEKLTQSENWNEIVSQGRIALKTAQESDKIQDQIRICAQLASTTFYQGDYSQALEYANQCYDRSKICEDPSLLIHALYLQSAVYRALASKNNEEQALFLKATKTATEALDLYSKNELDDIKLEGKIYFNLGASHADNPNGDIEQAIYCYLAALKCFENTMAENDCIRTKIRLGKSYLLQKEYALTEKIIEEARFQISTKRISMQLDYLEAQLRCALGNTTDALKIIKEGLVKADALGANEDKKRFISLLYRNEKEGDFSL